MAQKKKVPVKTVASKTTKPAAKTPNTKTSKTVTSKIVTSKTVKASPAAKPAQKPAARTAKPATASKAMAAKSTSKAAVKTSAKVASAKAVPKKAAVKTAAKPTAKSSSPAKAGPAKAAVKPVAKKVAAPAKAKAAAVAKPVAPAGKGGAATKKLLKAVAAAAAKPAMKRQGAGSVPRGKPFPGRSNHSINGVKGADAPVVAPKPLSNKRHEFKTDEFIVYPAHGVGQIVAIEEQEIAGMTLELFVITFEKDKMTLRVPTAKLESVGMRKLAVDTVVTKAMSTLKGRARVKRTMWSRRAQEYEAKINSGDLVSIAEVVRDLYRSESQPEQSYSERQLYEAALDRMARELAAVENIDERGALQRITGVLSQSAKGRRLAEEAAAEASESEEDSKAA